MKMKSFQIIVKRPKVRKPMPKPSRPISARGYSRKVKHKSREVGYEL